MDINKASEVYDFYLAEIEKAKYIKRTGSPGNYKYVYPSDEKKGQSGKKVVENSDSKVTNKQESENGERKMNAKQKVFENWIKDNEEAGASTDIGSYEVQDDFVRYAKEEGVDLPKDRKELFDLLKKLESNSKNETKNTKMETLKKLQQKSKWADVKENELAKLYDAAIRIDDKLGGKRKLADLEKHMEHAATGYWNEILKDEAKKK